MSDTTKKDRKLIKTKRALEMLGMSISSLVRLRTAGKLNSYTTTPGGRNVRWDLNEINAYLDSVKINSAQPGLPNLMPAGDPAIEARVAKLEDTVVSLQRVIRMRSNDAQGSLV